MTIQERLKEIDEHSKLFHSDESKTIKNLKYLRSLVEAYRNKTIDGKSEYMDKIIEAELSRLAAEKEGSQP